MSSSLFVSTTPASAVKLQQAIMPPPLPLRITGMTASHQSSASFDNEKYDCDDPLLKKAFAHPHSQALKHSKFATLM